MSLLTVWEGRMEISDSCRTGERSLDQLTSFHKYLLLTKFEGRTVSYGPSFSLLDLWPKREAPGP